MIKIKTDEEIKIMAEGGKKLSRVKNALMAKIKIGVSAHDIDQLADELIRKEGAEASFKKVPKYSWATCINANAGVVHGIPHKSMVFKKSDVVSVDVGIFYKGFHTDTSFTVAIGPDEKTKRFLATGKAALDEAIAKALPKNRIYDISEAIEKRLVRNNYSPIRALVGHGLGKELHEEPNIPCFTHGSRTNSPEIKPGMVFAIEVMYALGSPNVVLEADEWTISTSDGKISALFEDTVAITANGPKVLT